MQFEPRSWPVLNRIAFSAFSLHLFFNAAAFAVGPVITKTTTTGVGFVIASSGASGINASIGEWGNPFPGTYSPEIEPNGNSTFIIDVDVNDGGNATFDYSLSTYDNGVYDWFDIYVNTPTGIQFIVSRLGNPARTIGGLWESFSIPVTFDLRSWKNQHVQFVFSVVQDGFGDQTKGTLSSFSVNQICEIPPLPKITDPLSLQFEAANGNIFDFDGMEVKTKDAYMCVSSGVKLAGGIARPTSGYRPSGYQLHLAEVWNKWRSIETNQEPGCEFLKSQVRQEYSQHGLIDTQPPAGANGPHTRGLAFDMNWGASKLNPVLPDGQTIDDIAEGCISLRPLPTDDPVHFVPR